MLLIGTHPKQIQSMLPLLNPGKQIIFYRREIDVIALYVAKQG